MKRPLVSDELRSVIEPLLPAGPPTPKGGRPRVPNRAALNLHPVRAALKHLMGDAA